MITISEETPDCKDNTDGRILNDNYDCIEDVGINGGHRVRLLKIKFK